MKLNHVTQIAAAMTAGFALMGCETTPQKPTQVAVAAPSVATVPEVRVPTKFPAGIVAPVRVVTDNYHGMTVADPYRYMENTRDPEVAAWFKSQADATRKVLDRIPGRADLLKRISELSEGAPNVYNLQQRGGRVFYMKTESASPVARLLTRDSIGAAPRILVDPLAGHTGKPRTIDWFKASPDGRVVAYGMSEGGSENSVMRLVETATGRDLGVAIDRVVLAADWHVDGKSIFYNKLAEPGPDGRGYWLSSRAHRHVLNTPADRDSPLLGHGMMNSRDLIATDIPTIRVPDGSSWMVAEVKHGDAREISVFAAPLSQIANPSWRRIAGPADKIIMTAAAGDEIYLLSENNAPRGRILQTSITNGTAASSRVAVPQGDHVLRSFVLAQDAIYLREMNGGVDLLNRVSVARGTISGKRDFVRMPFDVSLSQMVADVRRPGIVVRLQSWIDAPQYFQVDARTGDLANLNLIPKPKADFSAMDEVRQYAMAKDGTRIPITLLYRKGTTLNAFNPTLLTGYGAYGITQSPNFQASRLAWLERGGIHAVCHVRGGGEYGSEWHKAGQKANKHNTVEDLITCADFLIQRRFTQPARLAIMGRSAGGIPVGNAILRRPDLFAAAIPGVGVLDMLRFETTPNGPPNVLEFGTTTKPDEFKHLHAISAYHQIKDDTRYPAVMATTGMNDSRVEPWMSAKYIARLQAASVSGKPKLLRVNYETGHGMGSTRQAQNEELADVFTFALWQMSETGFQPKD